MAKDKRRIISFEDYYTETMKSDAISEKHVISRNHWLESHKTNEGKKVEKVIDKIPADELEQAEELGSKSQIGSYIGFSTIVDLYGEEFQDVLDDMVEKSVLVHYWNDEMTIWQKKEDGLVRVK